MDKSSEEEMKKLKMKSIDKKQYDEHLKWKKARFSDQVIGKWSEKLEMDPSEVGTNSHLSETSLNLNHLNI